MNVNDIKNLLNQEIGAIGELQNFHGITVKNIATFVTEPFKVLVDPDDLETQLREMWVVLSVSKDTSVAFDPLLKGWSVIELQQKNKYLQIISSSTLSEALNGM